MSADHSIGEMAPRSEAPARDCPADPLTASVVRLVLHFGPDDRAVATGFLVAGRTGRFVATAFHNLSGGVSPYRRFALLEPPRPLEVEVWQGGDLIARFPTYAGGRSLFRVHRDPVMRAQCDIAAIDYGLLEANRAGGRLPDAFLATPGVNEPRTGPVYGRVRDMFLPAGRDVLVPGYPGGRDYAGRPIAVCCKIAAEPDDAMPFMLLSGPTSSGCSGAPVVARQCLLPEGGGYFPAGAAAPARLPGDIRVIDQWLGLYSGRLTSVGHDGDRLPAVTQIGVAWTITLVRATGDDGVPDA
ncbi:MAG: hypothetical protein F8N37_04100 [Telmatospirillum sp.]|nr:hypothetical protein [Telmatospirillum sp.]